MGCFVVCLFLARKCNASYWQSPVAGCVGPVLRKDVEHTAIAAAEYLVHACVQRTWMCAVWPEPPVLCRGAVSGLLGC